MGSRLVAHAGSGVGDGQVDVGAGGHALGPARVVGPEVLVGGDDREAATLGHRVTCVHDQVHHDLLDLAGVREHRSQIGSPVHRELDVLADQPLQHGRLPGDQRVEIDEDGLQHLPPAVGEELAGEARGPFGGLHDLLDPAARRVRGGELPQQDVTVADDHAHQVVEVVGDAAGQAAERLALLGLDQLGLGLLERLLLAPELRHVLHRAR